MELMNTNGKSEASVTVLQGLREKYTGDGRGGGRAGVEQESIRGRAVMSSEIPAMKEKFELIMEYY
jgi:hypothetical protein